MALAGGFFFVQMKQPFSHLWRAAARFDIARINTGEIRESADEADAVLLDFYARNRGRFVASCLCYAAAWSLGPLEIYILLRMLHQPASLHTALLVEVGRAADRARDLSDSSQAGEPGGRQSADPGDAGISAGNRLRGGVSTPNQGDGMGVVRAAEP